MKFSEIIGHEQLKQRLRHTVAENRVSHAQLFLGPEGSGKLALAIAYAQYINCRHRTPDDSCGECPSCKKYGKLIHPDLHFIYPINKNKEFENKKIVFSTDYLPVWRNFLHENNYYVTLGDWYDAIGIEKKQGIINADDADSVNRTLSYKAYESEYKVMIIWMVEKMNQTSANRLLKNLEEPPEKTLFLLITENQHQVISTILSRTQLVKVQQLEDTEIQHALEQRYGLEHAEARNISLLAEGNYGWALKLSGIVGSGIKAIDEERIRFELFREWMRRCFSMGSVFKDYDKFLELVPKLLMDNSREKQKEFLAYSLSMFRTCLHYHIGNHHLVKLVGEELEFVIKFSPFIHPRNIHFLTEEFNTAIQQIERNASANLIYTDLSHLLARILRMPASAQVKK